MQTIEVIPGRQSWIDLAIQVYGNADLVFQLITDNAGETDVDFAGPCSLSTLQVVENHPERNDYILKALAGTAIATL